MSYCALWLDHQHAYLFKFTEKGFEETKFKAENDQNHFFHSLTSSLNNIDEIMIMGPGVAKNEFKHHCENHHHENIAKKITGVRTMESHPTQARMLEEAHIFFKNLHMWTKNY